LQESRVAEFKREPTSCRRSKITAAALAFLAVIACGTTSAFACDTRAVAGGAAEFNSCETPWTWLREDESESLYQCASDVCSGVTVLRITLRNIAEPDLALSREQLLQSWTETKLPKDFEGYTIEMPEPISIANIGGKQGVLIPSKLTAPDGTAMTSFAFRIPLEKHYVVANATGQAEPDVIRKGLEAAVGKLTITKPAGQ
jgi:hypothetical protein